MMFGTREQFQYFSCAACDTLQIHSELSGEELGRHGCGRQRLLESMWGDTWTVLCKASSTGATSLRNL